MNGYLPSPVAHLNYHHLRYFWVIAHQGSLTRAARALHVSPSALSTQIRALEGELGQALFARGQRELALTEAGKVAREFADTIFGAGEELLDTFSGKAAVQRAVLRIGAMATLSRNFQLDFIRPALARHNVEVVLRSGNLSELIIQLQAYALDVILSTERVRPDLEPRLMNHLLAEHPVSLVASPRLKVASLKFPRNLRHAPLLLPTRDSSIRVQFDDLLVQAGVRPIIVAEADDMAMLRLLAREGVGVALVPRLVVRDELRAGVLRQVCGTRGLTHSYYAITLNRKFPNALSAELIAGFTACPADA